MALFGKKKEEQSAQPASASGTPVEDVLRMRQQGLNNNQIVQALQRSGYKTNQIFDAMNTADLKSAGMEGMEAEEEDIEKDSEEIEPAAEYQDYGSMGAGQQAGVTSDYDLRMEEIAEAIIDEKWQELLKNVNKIVEWKNSMEARMANLEQKFDALKAEYDRLHAALLEKITEYDSNIKNVGTEIKAMEQVFQKVLPTLTENVNELSRLTKSVKEKKK